MRRRRPSGQGRQGRAHARRPRRARNILYDCRSTTSRTPPSSSRTTTLSTPFDVIKFHVSSAAHRPPKAACRHTAPTGPTWSRASVGALLPFLPPPSPLNTRATAVHAPFRDAASAARGAALRVRVTGARTLACVQTGRHRMAPANARVPSLKKESSARPPDLLKRRGTAIS